MSAIGDLLRDLACAPDLADARCRNESALFDKTIEGSAPREVVLQARRDALQLCAECLCLQQCTDWVNSLPPFYRPRGICAGQLNTHEQRRPPGMKLVRPRWSA